MRILPAFSLLAVALTLSACQTAEEIRARDEATCRGYGFRYGTEGFANCLMNQDLSRRADQRAFMESDDDFFFGPAFIGGPRHFHHGHFRH